MRGYAALDSDQPLQDDRSLVLSAVDSMVSESLVQSTSRSLERQMAVAVARNRESNREKLRYTDSPMTYIYIFGCVCAQCKRNLYARCPTDDVTRLPSRVFEVIIFSAAREATPWSITWPTRCLRNACLLR